MSLKSKINLFNILLCSMFMNFSTAIATDEIALKQTEILSPTVLIQTRNHNGSGIIIERLDTDTEGIFEYRVLSNSHVTNRRFVTFLRRVNAITGKIRTETIDKGCTITVFNQKTEENRRYETKVIAESIERDLAILSFESDQKLAIAKKADADVLKQIRVFDEIFAIGCQLGESPIPTFGIISRIITGNHNGKEWIMYNSTTQITPGSSGGGLFKKHNSHYYLIGIVYRMSTLRNGQIIPHLSHSISMKTIMDFIDENSVTHP